MDVMKMSKDDVARELIRMRDLEAKCWEDFSALMEEGLPAQAHDATRWAWKASERSEELERALEELDQ